MKGKRILLLAAAGVGAYLLYTFLKKKNAEIPAALVPKLQQLAAAGVSPVAALNADQLRELKARAQAAYRAGTA